MNTPEPCSSCHNLYADCMYENDPTYATECKLGLTMGNVNCPKWVDYRVSYSDREKEYYGLTHLKNPDKE